MTLHCCLPLRALPAFFLFLGTVTQYVTRVSINVAILDMTRNASDLCSDRTSSGMVVSNVTGHEVFCWTENQKGLVKGAFYFGYPWFQVLGGRLSEVFGSKRVLLTSTLLSGILSMLSVPASLWNAWSLVAVRVAMGLAQGVLFPCINPMLIRWSPQNEQNKFSALASMGGTFGTIFIYPAVGLVLGAYNWQVVFYLGGVIAFAWCAAWYFLVTDEPTAHKCISRAEVDFIMANRSARQPSRSEALTLRSVWAVLWAFVTSLPVVVNMACFFANDWGIYTLLTEGPNFLSTVMKEDIAAVGFLSSVPYIGRFAFAQMSSAAGDLMVARPQLISRINVRRFWYTVAFLGPAAGLAALSYATNNIYTVILIMTIGYSLNGCNVPAMMNVVDIAPAHCGTLMGVCNGFSSFAGFFVPLVTTFFTEEDPSDPANWRKLFFLSTALYCVAVAVFCMFGKTEPIVLERPQDQGGRTPPRRSWRYGADEDIVVRDGDVAAAHLLQSESESDLETI